MTPEENEALAKAVVDEFLNRLQVGVGKGVLDGIWKWCITILLAGALYLYAAGHYKLPNH